MSPKATESRIKLAKLRASIMSRVSTTMGLTMNEIVKLPDVEALQLKRAAIESTVWGMKRNKLLQSSGVPGSNAFHYFASEKGALEKPKEKKVKVKPATTAPNLTLIALKNGNVRLNIGGLIIEIGVEK